MRAQLLLWPSIKFNGSFLGIGKTSTDPAYFNQESFMTSTQKYPLILASTSKYRSALLKQLNYEFSCVAPNVDEDQYKNQGHSPLALSQILSKLKAQEVFSRHQNACVIGSDQVCHFDGNILSKPKTIERAIEQLTKMQGKTHELITAVTIFSPDSEVTFTNTTKLSMRKLSTDEITRYVQEDMPLDCAGSYKLESSGIKLFTKIEMDDHTSIIGLPLIQLTTHLNQIGFPIY